MFTLGFNFDNGNSFNIYNVDERLKEEIYQSFYMKERALIGQEHQEIVIDFENVTHIVVWSSESGRPL